MDFATLEKDDVFLIGPASRSSARDLQTCNHQRCMSNSPSIKVSAWLARQIMRR
jgi:hypothetical protein